MLQNQNMANVGINQALVGWCLVVVTWQGLGEPLRTEHILN